MDIEFFGDIDRTEDGDFIGEYPGWYMDIQIEELEETISYKERQLSRGLIPPTEVGQIRAILYQEKARLHDILESKPKLSSKDKDDLSIIRRELGAKITEAMFTTSDMKSGAADAHVEATRVSSPCIEVRGKTYKVADECGCVIVQGKIDRSAAERVWKIISKLLNETTSTETIRPQEVGAAM